MKRFLSLAAIAVAFAFGASNAKADILVYDANLDGPSESPPNASPGTGFAEVTINTIANTMRVEVSFRDLLGTTTASHIHSATTVAGQGTAGVATTTPTFPGFPLGVTSGSYDMTFDMTQAGSYNPAFITANGNTTTSAEAALFAGIAADRAYLNIHTTVVPGGEIRGFLTLVPEPTTLSLLVPAGLFAMRRTRRA